MLVLVSGMTGIQPCRISAQSVICVWMCRRSGKPTSLGCFDHEEQAARAYDKMMLWCELHNSSGVKGGITNFDPAEYEKDLSWLQMVNQVRAPAKHCCLGHTYH